MPKKPVFTKIPQWIKDYGLRGDDRGAMADFIEIETRDAVNVLRAELLRLTKVKGEEELLDKVIGKKRSAKHGSYQNWAKLMLQWMAKA